MGKESSCSYLNLELNPIDNYLKQHRRQPSCCILNVTDEDQYSADQHCRVFSCNYCQRTFLSSQALGGHQNAHKWERRTLIAKRGGGQRGLISFGNYGQYYPITTMAHLPLHGIKLHESKNTTLNKVQQFDQRLAMARLMSTVNERRWGSSDHGAAPRFMVRDDQVLGSGPALAAAGSHDQPPMISAGGGGLLCSRTTISNSNGSSCTLLQLAELEDHKYNKLDLTLKL